MLFRSFLSNPTEAALLGSDGYQMRIAAVLLASYLQFFTQGELTAT